MTALLAKDALSMLVTEASRGGRRPLVGVSAGVAVLEQGAWAGHDATILSAAYTRAIREAGGRPVILSAEESWSPEEVADLDAIVITGGSDLDPSTYGATPIETDFPPCPERDEFELSLARTAIELEIPLLGVCRGLQIINVARGGTLIQHLPASPQAAAYPETGSALTEVEIQVRADSDLALAVGTRAAVNAYHHQAIERVGEGLRVVARHSSGVIHAVEASDASLPLVLGVQFHPEVTPGAQGIFETLVGHARRQGAAARSVQISRNA